MYHFNVVSSGSEHSRNRQGYDLRHLESSRASAQFCRQGSTRKRLWVEFDSQFLDAGFEIMERMRSPFSNLYMFLNCLLK